MAKIQYAISEFRGVNITFDDGTAAQLDAPIDSYFAGIGLVEEIEGQYFKNPASFTDLADATVLRTGRNPFQLHVFTVTTTIASGIYELVYVETKPNVDNEI